VARQDEPEIADSVGQDALRVRELERIKQELVQKGVDPFPPKFNEKGERVYGHSPEERIQMLRETQEEERKRKNPPVDPNSISAIHAELNKKPVRLTAEEEIAKHGRVLMRNEAKFPFTFDESGNTEVVITLDPGKYISTSLINIEVEMTYVRITVKDKLVQFPLSVEVSPSLAKVQRASTTGQLRIAIPLAPHVLKEMEEKRNRFSSASGID
jgi:protein TilB